MPKENTKTIGIEKGTVDRDSDEAQGRFIKAYSKGVDLATRTIDGIASTISLDRDEEIILPSAFEKTIPLFLAGSAPMVNAHQHRGPEATQVGWIMEMRIAGQKIPFKGRFVNDTEGPAERFWRLASDPKGKGIQFSIGFMPVRWIYGSVADIVREFPELKKILTELKPEDRLRVYTEIELLEVSCVPVGSNRDATQLLAAKAASENGERALDEFESAVAQKVVEKLGASETSATSAAEIKTRQSEILDKLSELAEAIELSSDTLGQVPPGDLGTPPPEGRKNELGRPGDSPGAKLRDAAEGLLKTCTD